MASKNPLGKAASTAIGAVRHPASTTGKVVERAKGTVALGRMLTEQAGKTAAAVAAETASAVRNRATGRRATPTTPPAGRDPLGEPATGTTVPPLRPVPEVNQPAHTVDEPRSATRTAPPTTPAAKKAPAKKAPAKKAAATKTAAKKAPATKTAAKKAAAKKSAATKTAAKKAPAKKSAATKTAAKAPAKKSAKKSSAKRVTATPADVAEVIEAHSESAQAPDVGVTTPVGTTGAAAAVNPDTAEADLNQPGTEGIVERSTAKRVTSETNRLRKAAERNPR